MKKLILILLIVLAVGGMVWAGYIFSRRSTAQPATGGGENAFQNLPATGGGELDLSSGGGLPTGGGALSLLSRSSASAYMPISETAAILVQTDGRIISVGAGSSSTLSGGEIQDLREAKFSPDGKKIAAAFGSPSPQLSVFDVATKSWQPIADGGDAFAWAPAGETLAYLSNSEPKTLFTLDLSGSKPKKSSVIKLRAEDVELAWAGKYIWLYDRPSAFTNSSLWRIDPAKKTMDSVIQDQPGLDIAWGENRALAFGSNLGQRGGRLNLIDFNGNLVQQMRLITLPDKCVFHQETLTASSTSASSSKPAAAETRDYLFCAIPRNPQDLSAAALPDDYYQGNSMTRDSVYKIDLSTGDLAPVWSEDSLYVDAVNLKISGGSLYFLNRWNEGVYKLKI